MASFSLARGYSSRVQVAFSFTPPRCRVISIGLLPSLTFQINMNRLKYGLAGATRPSINKRAARPPAPALASAHRPTHSLDRYRRRRHPCRCTNGGGGLTPSRVVAEGGGGADPVQLPDTCHLPSLFPHHILKANLHLQLYQ